MNEPQPPIVAYTNLLHEYHSRDAEPVKHFREQHRNNDLFQDRAKKVEALFLLSQAQLPS
jgi:hypothetical protein